MGETGSMVHGVSPTKPCSQLSFGFLEKLSSLQRGHLPQSRGEALQFITDLQGALIPNGKHFLPSLEVLVPTFPELPQMGWCWNCSQGSQVQYWWQQRFSLLLDLMEQKAPSPVPTAERGV